MKQKIDKSCGCLIEDILGESPEKSKDKTAIESVKKSDRLCPYFKARCGNICRSRRGKDKP